MKNVQRWAEICALILIALGGLAAPARAGFAFNQIKPPTCNAVTSFAWNYNVGAGTGVFDLPSDKICQSGCPTYANRLSHSRYFIGNGWTNRLDVRVAAQDLEANYDFLKWADDTSGSPTISQSTGTVVAPFTITLSEPTSHLWSGWIRFSSDFSVGRSGFRMDQVSACTTLPAFDASVPLVSFWRRNQSVLLGTEDVVIIQVSNGGTGSVHQTLAAWRDTGTTDVDIYVRCGAHPTATTFDVAGRSGSPQEMVEFTCPGSAYAAIHSFSGSGIVSYVSAAHLPAWHHNLTVGANFAVSGTEASILAGMLKNGAAQIYGATEGTAITNYDLFRNGDCNNCNGASCNICLLRNVVPCRSNVHGPTNRLSLCEVDWNAEVLGHEFGHYLTWVGDEYCDEPGTPGAPCGHPMGGNSRGQCGHSIMSHIHGDLNDFCDSSNHGFDKDPDPAVPYTALPSSRTAMSNAGLGFAMIGMVDNFDYQNFNFNSVVGNTVVH
jgi:hypothetical protein